jgi:hypothetical protein
MAIERRAKGKHIPWEELHSSIYPAVCDLPYDEQLTLYKSIYTTQNASGFARTDRLAVVHTLGEPFLISCTPFIRQSTTRIWVVDVRKGMWEAQKFNIFSFKKDIEKINLLRPNATTGLMTVCHEETGLPVVRSKGGNLTLRSHEVKALIDRMAKRGFSEECFGSFGKRLAGLEAEGPRSYVYKA